MHFADEIVDQSSLDFPEREKPHENEMKVAKMLIDTMSEPFDAEAFHDKYREELLAMIEARAAGKEAPKAKAPVRSHDNVVNLMDVLQKSLEESKKQRGAQSAESASERREAAKKKTARRKKSAA